MAIKTNFNYNGLEINGAYIRVENLSGNSKSGWDSLISVNNIVIETTEDETIEVKKQITVFNHSVPFVENERGYQTIYKSLLEKLGGVEA